MLKPYTPQMSRNLDVCNQGTFDTTPLEPHNFMRKVENPFEQEYSPPRIGLRAAYKKRIFKMPQIVDYKDAVFRFVRHERNNMNGEEK